MGGGERQLLPEFHRKRCSAGALIRDESGRLLLVKPAYRNEWLLPGGIVEADEDPLTALRREVLEEVGLKANVRRLWCVDYLPANAELGEALHFLFECATVPNALASAVEPRDPEIIDIRWMILDDALPLLPASIARRLKTPPGYLLADGIPQVRFCHPDEANHTMVGNPTCTPGDAP
ncbi:NUDIX hydrolase [Silanimonas sp.]|uniref:NUDIX domain-containing protein n=1 Tax=Silanimonas sp. TaxID=1929290 RepID=UPI001BC260ED|nr:NUDIX hydrolase [Silanimonas sp.]MBS3895443.1 NUDIX hydrolase [Silanimonas sp.]